jgi:phospholipid/cholesterol/gamma-HCH transport system permease protein
MNFFYATISPFFFQIGNLSLFYARSYRAVMGRQLADDVAKQMMRGLESLPIVISVTAFVGMNIVVQGYEMMAVLGAQDMVGMFLSMAAVRELAPILAAALVGAKTGCGMASEIATMKIREQIDALEVMSIDPFRYIVAPRLIAALIIVPLITVVSLWACILAGYVVAVYQFNLNGVAFLAEVFNHMSPRDIVNVIIKSFVFAAVCFPIICYAGFQAQGGARGVGDATNQAIVWGAIGIVTINAVLTALMY